MTDPDQRTIRKDDRLLDRLGRDLPTSKDGDDVELMLAAWRRGMPDAGPPDPGLVAAITAPLARPRRRLARTSLGVAASVVIVCGGVTVAAANARPDSPLWPVTRFVYGNLADSRMALDNADRAVADARTAVTAGRFPEATRLLASADRLADKVTEPHAAQRLRRAIAEVRGLLPESVTSTTGTSRVPNPTESLGVDAPPVEPGHDPPAPRDHPPGAERGPGGTGVPGPNNNQHDEPGPEDGAGDGDAGEDGDEGGDEGGKKNERKKLPKPNVGPNLPALPDPPAPPSQ